MTLNLSKFYNVLQNISQKTIGLLFDVDSTLTTYQIKLDM